MYKVECGIPIPPRTSVPNGLTAFLRSLMPGQSFVVPAVKFKSIKNTLYSGKSGGKFATRRLETGAYRVWRTT